MITCYMLEVSFIIYSPSLTLYLTLTLSLSLSLSLSLTLVRIPPEYSSSVTKRRVSPTPSIVSSHAPLPAEEGDIEEEFEVIPDTSTSISTETSKVKEIVSLLLKIWYEVVGSIIDWLETSSADYVTVVTKLRRGTVQSDKDESQPATPPLEEGATPTKETTPTRPLSELSPIVEEGSITSAAASSPPSLVAPPTSRPSQATPKFNRAGSIFLSSLKVTPTEAEEHQVQELEERLGDLTYRYSQRPRRFIKALYYWFLSHFEYVVFVAVILAIVHTGSFISFVYAALLMLWGVLSIPWPSKRFWLSLMFFTMLVLVAKYIYQFLLVTVIVSGVNYLFIGDFRIRFSVNMAVWCILCQQLFQ